MPMTLYSLFWCMFGQVGTDSVIITYPAKPQLHPAKPSSSASLSGSSGGGGGGGRAHQSGAVMYGVASDGATSIVETVGLMLFAEEQQTNKVIRQKAASPPLKSGGDLRASHTRGLLLHAPDVASVVSLCVESEGLMLFAVYHVTSWLVT